MKAKLYLPGTTVEDVDVADPAPEEMQARGIPNHPGEHNFIRWPAFDEPDVVAYRLEDADAAALVKALKAKDPLPFRAKLADGRVIERAIKVPELPDNLVLELPNEAPRALRKTDQEHNGAAVYVEDEMPMPSSAE